MLGGTPVESAIGLVSIGLDFRYARYANPFLPPKGGGEMRNYSYEY